MADYEEDFEDVEDGPAHVASKKKTGGAWRMARTRILIAFAARQPLLTVRAAKALRPKQGSSSASGWVPSARARALSELQDQLADRDRLLLEARAELKTLHAIQRRQDKALSKYEGGDSDMAVWRDARTVSRD